MTATNGQDFLAAASPPFIQVFTLGSFRVLVRGQVVEDHAWRRRTARQLFKCLLSRAGRRMTRDEVMELLWPESDPDAAASNLRSTVFALRHALERSNESDSIGVVFSDRNSVWLRPDVELWVDADEFEKKVQLAWRSSDPLPLLEQASELYGGHYLPDDLFEDWATERRDGLKQYWAELQIRLSQELERRGDPDAAAHSLQRLLQVDQCDERAARELMQLLARHGRRSDALRTYQRLVQALAEELEVEPATETAAIYDHLSSRDAPAPPVAATFRCAYPFPAPGELIGRESEFKLLERVLGAGRTTGQAALIGAPAGTGKSALLGRIVGLAQSHGVLCLAGGCYEERGAVPLGPFHDALVDYLLAHPVDRVRSELGNSASDLARVIPEIRYALNLAEAPAQDSPQLDRVRVFGAMHAFLRTLAERGPTLICLEDLHAADEGTLQLFHFLVRQTRRLPLVLIGTYRSDEVPAGQPLAQVLTALARERLAEHVRLPALDRPNTNRLVASLLDGSTSERLSDSLFSATGGNPLFLEQLVLALTEAGRLERRAGVWHGEAPLQGAPQVVGEVIIERLQRLSESCRNTLALAAVLGQAVDYEVLLAAAEPSSEAALLHDLDQAIGASVLQERPGGYAFRHALLRESVYWNLTTPRRMLLHWRVGEFLERLRAERADDYAAELAHHFMLGGESEAARSKALHYTVTAGRRAAQLSSYPEALEHFNSAANLIDRDNRLADTDTLLQVLGGRGLAEAELAKWSAASETSAQVLTLSTDPVQRARAHGRIAFGYTHTGDFARALEECDAGLAELAGVSGPDALAARLHLQQMVGGAWYLKGRYRELVELGRRMQVEAADATSSHPLALAHWVTGWGFMGQGQVDAAVEQYERAVAIEEGGGEKVDLAICFVNLGIQEYYGGRFAAAREHLGRALVLFRDSASELRAVNALQTLCRVWLADGEHGRATEQILQALAVETDGKERYAADGHHILGLIHVQRAEWDKATQCLEQALALRRDAGHMANIVESTVALGLVAEYSGSWLKAMARYEGAAAIAAEMDPSPQRVLALRCLGQLHLLRGDDDDANRIIGAAIEFAGEMTQTLEYAPTLLAMADVRAHTGDLAGAIEYAEDALQHARPLEQIAEAHLRLASLNVQNESIAMGQKHASEAMTIARQLDAPRLLSKAHLAMARTTRSRRKATEAFDAALAFADAAHTPFERARALQAYADFLSPREADSERATRMTHEANQLLERLRAGVPNPGPTAVLAQR